MLIRRWGHQVTGAAAVGSNLIIPEHRKQSSISRTCVFSFVEYDSIFISQRAYLGNT